MLRVDLIVSRHRAAVEFIASLISPAAQLIERGGEIVAVGNPWGKEVPVLSSATAEDVRGKDVAGNLPLSLAAEARTIYAVEFDGAPPRGREYGLEEMRAAGAHLRAYRVELALGDMRFGARRRKKQYKHKYLKGPNFGARRAIEYLHLGGGCPWTCEEARVVESTDGLSVSVEYVSRRQTRPVLSSHGTGKVELLCLTLNGRHSAGYRVVVRCDADGFEVEKAEKEVQ